MKEEIERASNWWTEQLVIIPEGTLAMVSDHTGLRERESEFQEELEVELQRMMESSVWDKLWPRKGSKLRTFGTSLKCWNTHVLRNVLNRMDLTLSDTDLPDDIIMYIDPGSVYVRSCGSRQVKSVFLRNRKVVPRHTL